MASDETPTYDELVIDRAKLIRELAQGPGLTRPAVQAIDRDLSPFRDLRPSRGDTNDYWPDLTADQLFDLIMFTVSSVVYSEPIASIRRALGYWGGDSKPRDAGLSNLTERRQDFLESEDITLRTLIRREQEGAEIVARHFDTAFQMSPNAKFAEDRGFNVSWYERPESAYENRISDLEVLVSILLEAAVKPRKRFFEDMPKPRPGNSRLERIISRNADRAAVVSPEALHVVSWRPHFPWEPDVESD